MRLINVHTLQLEEYFGNAIPPYAILSHTWGEEEVLFSELNDGTGKSKKGYEKIQRACMQARSDRIWYAWVDTVIIIPWNLISRSELTLSCFEVLHRQNLQRGTVRSHKLDV